MSAGGHLHAIMFWILCSYCLRFNTGELCKMKTINRRDATDMCFFFPVGTVCLYNNWNNCACLAVVVPTSSHNTCDQ